MVKLFHLNQFLKRPKKRGSLTVAAIIFVSIVMVFVILQCVVFSSKLNTIEEITKQYLN